MFIQKRRVNLYGFRVHVLYVFSIYKVEHKKRAPKPTVACKETRHLGLLHISI